MKHIALAFWLLSLPVMAQISTDRVLIKLKVDNDFFAFNDQDNYYTAGETLSLTYSPENFLFTHAANQDKVLVSFIAGHQLYTPKHPNRYNVAKYDMPFAGWLFGGFNVAAIKKSWEVYYGLEFGVTGKASGGKELHQWYHEVMNIHENPLWLEQIPSEFMLNINGGVSKIIDDNVVLNFDGVVGSKDIRFSTSGLWLFHNNYTNYLLPKKERRVWGMISVGYAMVMHNALIEGSIWNTNAPLVKVASVHNFELKGGVHINLGSVVVGFNYICVTRRTHAASGQMYGQVLIGVLLN